jgi:uncharacterized membrane protein
MKKFADLLADLLTNFVGSWYFISLFFGAMFSWILLNSFVISIDPFPFILLNLVLSTLAAVQGSIIMMSQKRQEVKDRQRQVEIHRLVKNCEEFVQKIDKHTGE